ncbi:uncharacterized protein [Triticum aestivum]|uniref:uncharacterized protein n=1 Tax=Triticum aestivum TaxID=4565 RepID=UPI001D005BCF|nr:uncharacterized protein LOC123075919 [Triticum aestivum]
MMTPRFVNEVRRTRLLPGAMTTGAPPRDTATPATRAPAQAASTPLRACRYLVIMGYNVGCLLIYKRPRVQRVRLRHYKYPTHTTTPSPRVTQLVQNIRHKHNTHNDEKPYHFDAQGIDIKATVTVRASTVEAWISRVWTNFLRDAERKLVGLDTEFSNPVFGKRQKDLPKEQKQRAAVLQLCVANECLVYHIVHARRIPAMLRMFIADKDIVFCGAGISQDQEMLGYYGLNIASSFDLQERVEIPKSICSKPTPSLIDLSNYLLGTKLTKDGESERLRRSGWGAFPLTLERIRYAAVDARLSFEVARRHFRSASYDRPGDRLNSS